MNSKYKILLISHELSYTGAPISLLRICKILQKNNYNIEVWSLNDGDLKKEYEKINTEVKIVKNIDIFKNSYKKYIKNNFKLVICNTVETYCFYSVIRYIIPVVWYIRECQNLLSYQKNKLLLNTLRNASNIYCVSEYARDFIIKNYNNNVEVLHNAVEDFSNKFPEHKHFNNSKLNILCSGSLIRRKGFDILINAIKNLPMDLQEKIELSIIGALNGEQYSVNILKEIENIPNIHYLGLMTDIKEKFDLYNKTDIVIVPSRDESCSLVVLEAIMMSCPVIISENVGAKYLMDEKIGWIFENENSEQLKNILIGILNNNYDIQSMSKCARKKYEETSTIEIYEKNILKMIEENIYNQKLVQKNFFNEINMFFGIILNKIKERIIYVTYIILVKLGIKDSVKKILQKCGYKFDE